MAVTQKQIGERLGVSQQLVALALQGHPRVAEETRTKILQTAQELGYDPHAKRQTSPKAVTQKQIGDQLGVSQQLVALALRGDPHVSEETRDKVVQAAKELGYNKFSNRHARILIARRHGKRATTGILAVILESAPAEAPATAAPYFRECLHGIEIEAGRRELDILLVPAKSERLPLLIDEGWVDGVMCLGSHKHLFGLNQQDIPVVTVGCSFPSVPSLLPDDEEGIRKLMRHLIDLGHKRIAYIGTASTSSSFPRVLAYRRMLEENGLAVDESLIIELQAFESSTAQGEAFEELLAQDRQHQAKLGIAPDRLPSFTAVVCYNDPMAIDTIRKAQQLGIKVPEELSVTGFDDVSPQYNFQPTVTSVRIPLLEMGRSAVQAVCEIIVREAHSNRETPQPKAHIEHQVFPIELAIRESSSKARLDL
jgi:DNA-binding LacI/PurR family transcriptional regulator